MTDAAPRTSAREINETIRYTCWSVFRRTGVSSSATADSVDALVAEWAANDVAVRGFYDVSVLRADADLMVWTHAPSAEAIQASVRAFRDLLAGAAEMTWSAMALHRPAEFNKGHVPAFMAGEQPRSWVAVYPFVRSYEWYLLPEEERRAMLVEHGMMGRSYQGVLSNTVASFALGDYEWILALESDELHEIVDMMRHLRSSTARRHVREEVPFFTGRRISAAAAVELVR